MNMSESGTEGLRTPTTSITSSNPEVKTLMRSPNNNSPIQPNAADNQDQTLSSRAESPTISIDDDKTVGIGLGLDKRVQATKERVLAVIKKGRQKIGRTGGVHEAEVRREYASIHDMRIDLIGTNSLSDEEKETLVQGIIGKKDIIINSLTSGKTFEAREALSCLASLASVSNTAQEYATSIILDNLPTITSLAENDETNLTLNTAMTTVCSAVPDSIDSNIDKGRYTPLVAFIADHLDRSIIEARKRYAKRGTDPDSLPALAFNYYENLRPLLNFGSEEDKKRAVHIVNDLLRSQEEVSLGGEIVGQLLKFSQNEEVQKEGRSLIWTHLKRLGLDPKKMFLAWGDSNMYALKESASVAVFEENFTALCLLQTLRLEAPKTLNEVYGISDFARYPTDLLVNQFDQRENSTIPYGIAVYPTSDHNGAFYRSGAYDGLATTLGQEFALRFYEVSSIRKVVSVINSARHKYGPIRIAFIGGHGSPTSISLGFNFDRPDPRKERITTDDIQRKGASALETAFIPNPTIVLVSCGTGALGGIGQQISRLGKHGATVIAPQVATNLKRVSAQKGPDNNFHFFIEYRDENTDAYYNAGNISSKINIQKET